VHLNIFIYININQLDELNFIINLFQASTCFENMCSSSGRQIVLYSLWYHHTETSEWSKITKIIKIVKIQFYKYENIVVQFMCEFLVLLMFIVSNTKNSQINCTTMCSYL